MIKTGFKDLDVPAAWLNALRKIQTAFPPAVIAGGCLRDLWNGVKPKDVDIFVPLPLVHTKGTFNFEVVSFEPDYPVDVAQKQLMDMFPNAVCIARAFYGRGNAELERTILSVWHIDLDGEEFDIVFIADKVDITTFDINICQIACDGEDIAYTEHFLDGVKNKELRVMNINRTDRNCKRIERLRLKYPDWSVHDGNTGD